MRGEEKREWDKRHERMVSSLMQDFVCFEYGEYVMDELRLILKKTEKEMKNLCQEAKFVMEAMMKLMPDTVFTHDVSIYYRLIEIDYFYKIYKFLNRNFVCLCKW